MLQKVNKISSLLIFFLTFSLNISLAEDQIYKFKSKNTNFIGSVAKEKDGSKVDAAVERAFLRKRSRRSCAIFGSFLNLVVAPKLTPNPARLTHP